MLHHHQNALSFTDMTVRTKWKKNEYFNNLTTLNLNYFLLTLPFIYSYFCSIKLYSRKKLINIHYYNLK